jgi:hypothetical protein
MTLALRFTVFTDGERRPDDYEVRHDGRTRRPHWSTGRELWRWTQSGIFQPTHGVNGGVADTLDEAKAAFRAAASATAEKSRRDMLGLSISAHDPEPT